MGLDVSLTQMQPTVVFSGNITHNLTDMARAARLYVPLWHPDQIDIVHASDLVDYLETGIAVMKNDPERFRKFDSPNGWGVYVDFIRFCEEYLAACKANPDAEITADR